MSMTASTTSNEVLLTADMPNLPTSSPTITDSTSKSTKSVSSEASGSGGNRTFVIGLSSGLSALVVLVVAGTILICWRHRRQRRPFFARGISPIDDDEIATWKRPRNEKGGFGGEDDNAVNEKAAEAAATTVTVVAAPAPAAARTPTEPAIGATVIGGTGSQTQVHTKHGSTSSVKKPPSVIVYCNAHGQAYRQSSEDGSPRTCSHHSHNPHGSYSRKMSLEKALPQTPIQARAPNAIPGLTDEAIPGDEAFLPNPRRQPSRLAKLPPNYSSQRRQHRRKRSSRSSTRSFADYGSGGSDVDLSPNHSHDQHIHCHGNNHWRIYSSSSIPPRLSFGDEAAFSVGVHSPCPLSRDDDIGRALG